jgi:hypothetical protein
LFPVKGNEGGRKRASVRGDEEEIGTRGKGGRGVLIHREEKQEVAGEPPGAARQLPPWL